MKYNVLGKTGLKVSEIAFGSEWCVDKSFSDVEEMVRYCENEGINFLDCWMSEPVVRTNLGRAIKILVINGLSRDILVLPGKIISMLEPVRLER